VNAFSMETEFHRRVRQIFDQALERPEAERPAFVKTASAGDAALSDEVERLLRARGESDSFLDATVGNTGQIGRYLIRGELGRGAMGIVYDAVDPMIGRRVAVKVISLKAGMDASQAEFLKERLFREARSAGRLFHPGIVVIFDVGLHEDAAFITMEHVDGPSLLQLLADGRLDSKAALGILQQTAAALDYAHRHGVVHRDIKPANIMLQGRVTVKVADFGIAKLMSAQNQTLTGVLMGTPSYMSPEQVEARAVDGRADQFALAVMAYELLTGTRPFQADSMPTVAHMIVYGPRPSAQAVNPTLPPGIDAVLDRALSRFPEQRFPTCTEFTSAIEAVLSGQGAVEKKNPAREPAKVPKVQKKRGAPAIFYVGGIAALVIVALVMAFVYYRSLQRHPTPTPAASPVVVAATAPSQAPAVLPAAAPSVKPTLVEVPELVSAKPADAPADKVVPASKPKIPPTVRAHEFYNAALVKLREGKPQDAFTLFRQAADLGDANAMQELGESYANGEGVSKDDLEALRWFLRAAGGGNTAAMLTLGGLYLFGSDAVPQSDDDAVRWFQKAADLKNPAGLYDLAGLYEKGQGVPRSMEKAKQLYQESAALGNAEAQRRLAALQAQK
jgi:TPR repeat protein/tRNA A-37 threonylcarbamoyl transferase component Bud32